MACPFFYPLEPREPGTPHPTLPLGDAWAGSCRTLPDAPWQPEDPTLRTLCNLGYARGACPRFPSGDSPDAVRFSVMHDEGEHVRIYYVVERGHLPFAHGPLEYSRRRAAFADPPADANLDRQAAAYVSSYLRLRAEKPEASSR
jgi:hypothetical protein